MIGTVLNSTIYFFRKSNYIERTTRGIIKYYRIFRQLYNYNTLYNLYVKKIRNKENIVHVAL